MRTGNDHSPAQEVAQVSHVEWALTMLLSSFSYFTLLTINTRRIEKFSILYCCRVATNERLFIYFNHSDLRSTHGKCCIFLTNKLLIPFFLHRCYRLYLMFAAPLGCLCLLFSFLRCTLRSLYSSFNSIHFNGNIMYDDNRKIITCF
jgi:hypothetical protein